MRTGRPEAELVLSDQERSQLESVLNGAVLAAYRPRHRHQEFLSFLREIDKERHGYGRART